jgi:hypothetical protein
MASLFIWPQWRLLQPHRDLMTLISIVCRSCVISTRLIVSGGQDYSKGDPGVVFAHPSAYCDATSGDGIPGRFRTGSDGEQQ